MPRKFLIFYSWQSDLPNATNRGLIERAIEQAIASSTRGDEMDLEPVIDRDTIGVPGAPDIASTILAKIDKADAFVADISIINAGSGGRPTPNPNVLIELGYALRALGWERTVLVFNDAFGALDQLPFDLQRKRVVTYTAQRETEDRAADRKVLALKLRAQIESVVQHDRGQRQSELYAEAVQEIGGPLIDFLIYASEVEERFVKPWITEARELLDLQKDTLRRFSATPTAISLGLADRLQQLAIRFERAAHHRSAIGPTNWAEYKGKVADAVEIAQPLYALLIRDRQLSPGALAQARVAIETELNKLDELANRARAVLAAEQWGYVPQAQRESSEIGSSLLHLSYYDLNRISTGFSDQVRELGRRLHLLETLRTYADGGASSRGILQGVIETADAAKHVRRRMA